jgi:predicted nucleotidyltransferase
MEATKLLKKIAKHLSLEGIEYMVIGGQAVLIYGEPRLTKDIDITLGLHIDQLEKILKIVKKLKLKILVSDIENFVKETFVLPVLDQKTGFRIDFIFSFSEYEKTAIKRVNKIEIDGIKINFASIEDIIIHKIISGRERDLEDVKKIILKNKEIDLDYILNWLKFFEDITEQKLIEKFLNIKNIVYKDGEK